MFKKIIIIAFLLVVLAGAAVYQLSKPFSKQEVLIEPEEAVESFYKDWISYKEEAPGKNPIRDKIYQTRNDVTDFLIGKLDGIIDSFNEDSVGYDPVLCAQDLPSSLGFEEVIRTAEIAVVKVSQDFFGITKEIMVYLELVNGNWKIDDIDCLIKEKIITEDVSREIAENWIEKVSPTYTFDGMNLVLQESLKVDSADCRNCYQFVYSFESRQAGYGDRTGQMLAQVITPHTIAITIENDSIIEVIIDDVYDELNQKMLENI